MSEPYLSEIRMVSFKFPPRGWALCNGQLLPILQNQALFSLLGTTYGGNGQTMFALPDLQGSVVLGMGAGHALGEVGGSATCTLGLEQLPNHTHGAQATSGAATSDDGTNLVLAAPPSNAYAPPVSLTTMYPSSIGYAGGSQPHTNMQPYLVLVFIIALQGIFPSRF
jgi:microcystin-dependent protein